MPGADNSLTLPAPKISEGNAIEIIEIDEWVLGLTLPLFFTVC